MYMDNNMEAGSDLSVSAIVAFSNVKEEREPIKNYSSKIFLILMVLFVLVLVGVSVINFGSFAQKQGGKIINDRNVNRQDLQKLAN